MFQFYSVITVLYFLHYNVILNAAAVMVEEQLDLAATNNSLLPNSVTNVMNIVSHKIKDSVNNIIDPVWKELLLTVSREFTRFALRLEFFTIAAGGHLTMPVPEEQADNEFHEIAVAVTELWLKLNTMERVEEIITNATKEVLKDSEDTLLDLNQNEIRKMTKTLKLMFERINTTMCEDPELYPKYLGIKKMIKKSSTLNASEHVTYLKEKPRSMAEEYKIFKNWFAIPRIKKFLVNKMFLMRCTKYSNLNLNTDEQNHYILGRALITLARESTRRKRVQRTYYEAIKKTSQKLVSNIQNEHVYNGFLGELTKYSDKILILLFNELEKQINKDPAMTATFQVIKQQIIKDCRTNTYQIDYWPL